MADDGLETIASWMDYLYTPQNWAPYKTVTQTHDMELETYLIELRHFFMERFQLIPHILWNDLKKTKRQNRIMLHKIISNTLTYAHRL